MVKNLPASAEDIRSHGFDPWVWKIPLEEGLAVHSSILAWRIPVDRGAWRAAVHGLRQDSATDGTAHLFNHHTSTFSLVSLSFPARD